MLGNDTMAKHADVDRVADAFEEHLGPMAYQQYVDRTGEVLNYFLLNSNLQQMLKMLRSPHRQDAMGSSFFAVLSWCKTWQQRAIALNMQTAFDQMTAGVPGPIIISHVACFQPCCMCALCSLLRQTMSAQA